MPQRPQDTLQQLCAIFPSFKNDWEQDNAPPEDGLIDGVYYEWTHHAVLRQFLQFFARHRDSFTDAQLRELGNWINHAVSQEDEIENAVATCFLEHMQQVRVNRVLAPYLSRKAKDKARA